MACLPTSAAPQVTARLGGLPASLENDATLEHLKGLTKLRELNLGFTKVTDAGLAHLVGLTGLTALWLHDARVTDAGLAPFKGRTDFLRLDLSCPQITDATMTDFVKNQSGLLELDLEGTQVTDASLNHIQALNQLRILNLGARQITDAGLTANVEELLPLMPERTKSHYSDPDRNLQVTYNGHLYGLADPGNLVQTDAMVIRQDWLDKKDDYLRR